MQTKTQSAIETVVSTFVGFGLSFVLNLIVLPFVFDVHPTAQQNFLTTAIFTLASLVRGYYLRRFFNWLWRHPR